jgi:hypothetical protein
VGAVQPIVEVIAEIQRWGRRKRVGNEGLDGLPCNRRGNVLPCKRPFHGHTPIQLSLGEPKLIKG